MNVFLVAVLAYLVVMLALGILKSRAVKSQADFMVAGRSVPAWMLVLTLTCTWIGSGSIIAGAGLAYDVGLSELWMSAGAWVGIGCVYFLAGRVRRIADFTVPDMLERRYGPAARVLGTVTIVIAYMTIAAYQFKGGGMVLELVAGIPREYGIPLTAVFVVGFTALAGMVSVITADVVNGILITVGVLVTAPLLIVGVGGWDGVTAALPADHFEVFGRKDVLWGVGVFLPTFFLLLGESGMYQKFFSARDARTARRAVVGWIVGTIVIETAICIVAVAASARFPGLRDHETVILHLARHPGEAGLPAAVGVVLLCAAVAIIVSTANAFLLTPSTNIARDVYQRFVNPGASERRVIAVQRIALVALGALAYLLLTRFRTVLAMAFTAYTMVGAGLTPAILAAFLWRRATPAGGVASIAIAMVVTVGITVANMLQPEDPLLGEDYIVIPAAAASIAALLVVSLLTRRSDEERLRPFFEKPADAAGPWSGEAGR